MRPLVLPLLVPLVTGCAELRTDFIPATGAPVYVHDRTVTRQGVEQVETGETRDRNGNVIATSYANQAVSWQEREVYPIQGGQRIDDESFYRITHDDDAVRRYDDYHHGGVTRNTVGWILLGLGLGVAGGGGASWAYGASMKDDAGNVTKDGQTFSTAGYVGLGVGAALATLGFTLISLGRKQAADMDVRLIDDPGRMKADAARYDRILLNTGPLARPAWQSLYRTHE